ncbi:amidase [bacterium]|nr:MAG: amidase [bacterium]
MASRKPSKYPAEQGDDVEERSSDPVTALEAALARTEANEARLQAWVAIDARDAREQARRISAEAPLAGLVLGVKDIFDVAGWFTRCGLPDQMQEPAARDAFAVARLRAAGAIVLGKTQTTAYAWLDPAPTANPYDSTRTPGGSSAGSAAAVAAGHCHIALGSQTAGSTLRPASFCGIVGFKPTFGRISTEGVTPLAPSLDHVGIFAQRASDAIAAARALDSTIEPPTKVAPLRIGVADLAGDDVVEPASLDALARATRAFRETGCEVDALHLPDDVACGGDALLTVAAYESVQYHGRRWRALGAALPPHLATLLVQGHATPRERYDAALAEREQRRPRIDALFAGVDLLLTPCAPGEAPERATTGDSRYVRPWTFYGLPAIAVPCGRGPLGLPVGVQLVAPAGDDGALLAAALRLETALAQGGQGCL